MSNATMIHVLARSGMLVADDNPESFTIGNFNVHAGIE